MKSVFLHLGIFMFVCNSFALAQESNRSAQEEADLGRHRHQLLIGLDLSSEKLGTEDLNILDANGKSTRVRKMETPDEYLKVFDANGKPMQLTKVTGAIPAKKIVRVRTMSILDVEGSHFVLIEIGGTLYRIDLPD